MLTPQFSLRRLLLIVTVCAVLCLVPVVATRGYLWALGLALALVAAMLLIVIQAVLFVVTRMVSYIAERQQSRAAVRK